MSERDDDLDALAEEIVDMSTATEKHTGMTDDIEAIESLIDDLDDLDDLDLSSTEDDLVEEDIAEEPEADAEAEKAEAAAADLDAVDAALEREEIYSEMDAADLDPAEEKKAAEKAKERKARSPRKSAGPRVERDMSAIDPKWLVLEGDISAMSEDDLAEHKATTMTLKPTQKKVAEKFENLFTSIAGGRAPSVYVMKAFALLDEKKTVTSTDIVAMFKLTHSQGTAQSQAGQIMNLFDAVKIAKREKNTLTLNEKSNIAPLLRSISAASA